MQDILEFSEIDIPEKNPNPPNDIYKKDTGGGNIVLLLMSIINTIVGVFFCVFMVNSIITYGGDSVYYWGIILMGGDQL